MRERRTSKIFTKAEVFAISGSGDGVIFNKKPLMNEITHNTNDPVDVFDILGFTGQIKKREHE